MSGPASIQLLLVDDHAVVLEGLRMVLARYEDFDIVGTASGGEEAVRRAVELRPDVILMDLSMPGIDGVEATRRIRAELPEARVLALTAFLETRLVTQVVEAGAVGYLLKSAGGDELSAAIRAIVSGGMVITPSALPLLTTTQRSVGDDLTPREREVLDLIVHGLSNKQIASRLGLATGTIRINVSNILAKLGAENRTEAAYVAHQAGLVGTAVAEPGQEFPDR